MALALLLVQIEECCSSSCSLQTSPQYPCVLHFLHHTWAGLPHKQKYSQLSVIKRSKQVLAVSVCRSRVTWNNSPFDHHACAWLWFSREILERANLTRPPATSDQVSTFPSRTFLENPRWWSLHYNEKHYAAKWVDFWLPTPIFRCNFGLTNTGIPIFLWWLQVYYSSYFPWLFSFPISSTFLYTKK